MVRCGALYNVSIIYTAWGRGESSLVLHKINAVSCFTTTCVSTRFASNNNYDYSQKAWLRYDMHQSLLPQGPFLAEKSRCKFPEFATLLAGLDSRNQMNNLAQRIYNLPRNRAYSLYLSSGTLYSLVYYQTVLDQAPQAV